MAYTAKDLDLPEFVKWLPENRPVQQPVVPPTEFAQVLRNLSAEHPIVGPHTKRKFTYAKELCLLVGGSARARHEER
jgi:hypothetical protein